MAPHRLYASIVAAGVSLSGCTCSESHPPSDGSAPDAIELDAPLAMDAPAAHDAPVAGDTGPDACPAHCTACDDRPECGACLTCIL